MRKQTVLEVLKQELSKDRDRWQENAQRLLLGQTVLTNYNNRTYRIDEIDFTQTPESTFKQKDTDVSFIEYYQRVIFFLRFFYAPW